LPAPSSLEPTFVRIDARDLVRVRHALYNAKFVIESGNGAEQADRDVTIRAIIAALDATSALAE
jgi:hypothetical protein